MNRAEVRRRELERYRQDVLKILEKLQKRNVDLEAERSSIEASHIIKNEKYERQFRNWMNRLQTEYFHRLESELFNGYKTYMNRIELYIVFINGAIKQCQNPNYAGRILEYILGLIDRMVIPAISSRR